MTRYLLTFKVSNSNMISDPSEHSWLAALGIHTYEE